MKTVDETRQTKEDLQFTLSKFSHEIRNPIALVSSELQLIAFSHPEVTDYEGWTRVVDNLDYTRTLLNEFSTYNNATRLSPKNTELSVFLNSVLAAVRNTMSYLGIELVADIPDGLPTLPIDHTKMRQALLNLLRNAQEAVPSPGGRITVKASEYLSRVCISISDNGSGILPEQKKEIFTLFFSSKQDGTGIGLPITRQIIEAHGGSIEVESTPHQGTVFRIFLG